MDTAYFVLHPRAIGGLRKPHALDAERPYEIVADVTLAAIDYENFITDMLIDRQFIEDNAAMCGEGETMKCIFVHCRGRAAGILVVPESQAFVKYAALLP